MPRSRGTALSSSKVTCCVVGCRNKYYNSSPSVKFYSFPNKWYEKERKSIWINNVRRNNNTEWQPKPHSRICSQHFVGNVKSSEQGHPGYNPTIFPKEHRQRTSGQAEARYHHLMRRSNKKQPLANIVERDLYIISTQELEIETNIRKMDTGCQTENNFEAGNAGFVFECTFNTEYREVSTQVATSVPNRKISFASTSEKCDGNDENIDCGGFHGFSSIKTDEELNSICGFTIDRFMFLLSLMSPVDKNSKLTNANRLLLFLVRMKLGLSNAALGVFFGVHHSTAGKVFQCVLEELVQRTKNFIFWPTREVIDTTMPKAFRKHYPTCRAIVHCTKVEIQQPKNIVQRIHTYSDYKSRFTAKYLIVMAPTGMVTFLSNGYGGRSSDAFITNDCGFLDLLEPNDTILSEKYFPDIKCKDEVVLVLPPFVHDIHLTYEEVNETYSVASVRIHMERTIERIKTYTILQKVPYNLMTSLDDIVRMCCILANLQPSIVAEDSDEWNAEVDHEG